MTQKNILEYRNKIKSIHDATNLLYYLSGISFKNISIDEKIDTNKIINSEHDFEEYYDNYKLALGNYFALIPLKAGLEIDDFIIDCSSYLCKEIEKFQNKPIIRYRFVKKWFDIDNCKIPKGLPSSAPIRLMLSTTHNQGKRIEKLVFCNTTTGERILYDNASYQYFRFINSIYEFNERKKQLDITNKKGIIDSYLYCLSNEIISSGISSIIAFHTFLEGFCNVIIEDYLINNPQYKTLIEMILSSRCFDNKINSFLNFVFPASKLVDENNFSKFIKSKNFRNDIIHFQNEKSKCIGNKLLLPNVETWEHKVEDALESCFEVALYVWQSTYQTTDKPEFGYLPGFTKKELIHNAKLHFIEYKKERFCEVDIDEMVYGRKRNQI